MPPPPSRLCAENVLLHQPSEQGRKHAKLADFGLSTIVERKIEVCKAKVGANVDVAQEQSEPNGMVNLVVSADSIINSISETGKAKPGVADEHPNSPPNDESLRSRQRMLTKVLSVVHLRRAPSSSSKKLNLTGQTGELLCPAHH